MTTLVLMYVYFDSNGDIKAIAPNSMTDLAGVYKVMTTSLEEVEPFLLSKKNTFDYYVREVVRVTDVAYKITRKEVLEVNRLRFIGNALTEVPVCAYRKDANVLIELCTKEQQIRITLNPYIKSLIIDGTDDEKQYVRTIKNTQLSQLFFTKKHDPHFLLHTVTFSPMEMFREDSVSIPYSGKLVNTSIFTKKLIDGYGYLIK